ncbi:uncharacterized protein LOC120063017 isoform X3 [Salvelinus namaycush]|uniref:Uncharacterized protein LOC120063017 isoform X3 n=1 Tax=Salvelinus namaycush TaxID=8040 RepID=A0A8U1F3R1_SALNM|nr:uncharacterized protein LOC120063017 isoform X3 [Salvelinus namaycush]
MANSFALHTQLASIMEVLANAAVVEICELVDNGYAVLHSEISRGQKENEALRRKLRLMDLKVSRASTLRAGMGSSILAHSCSRAHHDMESKRTSSCDIQCLRAVDSQLVTSLFREGKSSGDTGQTTTQRKPAAFNDIKPKSPTIKEERREEAWENHDQQERQSTEALDHVDGGEMHSSIDTEAAQPISKQENDRSCMWVVITLSPLEGRQYHITKEQLEFLVDCHMTIRQMVDVLNVSHSVVKRRMRWRIVIHGAVDGYSRLVVFLASEVRDLDVFASQWNHHGLRTEQRQSPLQLFVSGSLAMQRANLTAYNTTQERPTASAGLEPSERACCGRTTGHY